MRSNNWLLVLGLCVPLLAGCGGGSAGGVGDVVSPTSPTPPTGGTLRVAVTDDPFPIDGVLEASVEIGRLEAHHQELGEWVVLTEETFTINLVGLSNGIVEEIIDLAVDPGTYDQFRFITGPGRIVLDPEHAMVEDEGRLADVTIQTPEGEVVTSGYVFTVEDGGVKFPSGPQTGIKVHVDPPVVVTTGLSGDLLLEFDLGRNFVANGPITHKPGVKRMLFTPSVKASNTTVNGSVTVVVWADEGVVGDPADDVLLQGAEVWLADATDAKVTHTFSDANGVAVLAVAPGTYTLKADKFGFVEGEIAGVEIALGNRTEAGSLVLVPSNLVVTGIVYTDVDTAGTDDDYPVEGVSVALELGSPAHSDSKTTDTAGAFTFDHLEEYTYDLTLSKTGFTTYVTTWAPASGPMTVRLDPLDQAVSATVKGAGETAVSGAVVTATDSFGNTWTVSTDSAGLAGFTLPTGTYVFTATSGSDAYAAPAALEVVGDTDDTTEDAVELGPVTP